VIDGATYDVTTVSAGLGREPSPLAINTVTNKIYVGDDVSNDVTVIDGQTNQTQTISLVFGPGDFAINTVTNQTERSRQQRNGPEADFWITSQQSSDSASATGYDSNVIPLLRCDIASVSVLKISGPRKGRRQTPLRSFLCDG
jgi:YVTN family beta-propeller protein